MIKAGKAPHVQETPVLNEERNLEDESVEYLDALAKERKLKLDKKWEKKIRNPISTKIIYLKD